MGNFMKFNQNNFEEIFQIVSAGLAQSLNIDASIITSKQELIYDLLADQLDMIELIMFIEEKLNVELPDDVFDSAVTVEDIIIKIFEIRK